MNRYARHLPVIGEEGQRLLRAGSVLSSGRAGWAVRSPSILPPREWGASGWSTSTWSTRPTFTRSLYGTSDIGRPKLEAAGIQKILSKLLPS